MEDDAAGVSTSDHLGKIDVYLEAGTAYVSNKPRGAIHANTPPSAVDETMKKVGLKSPFTVNLQVTLTSFVE